MVQSKVDISVKIDTEKIVAVLDQIATLENNDQVFRLLSNVAKPKQQLLDALEQVEAAEREIKSVISGRARALYGNDWTAIAGKGYKIGRQLGGAVYEAQDIAKIPDEFKKVSVSLNSDAITDYAKANGKLPKGIAPNKGRSESIRIAVDKA